MPTFEVTVDFVSKRVVEIEAASSDEAAVAAMRMVKESDPNAGPVEYLVTLNGEVVAEQRAWGGKKKSDR